MKQKEPKDDLKLELQQELRDLQQEIEQHSTLHIAYCLRPVSICLLPEP